jgi:hypothetical protein
VATAGGVDEHGFAASSVDLHRRLLVEIPRPGTQAEASG